MLLVFCLFQNYKTVKQIIYWFDPELENFHIDMDRVSFLQYNELVSFLNL